MIYVLTIHWQSEAWIDIQLEYLKKHINEPFKVFTFLNNVPNYNNHKNKFDYSSNENIKSHPIKLNLLADLASFDSEDENDLLMFIDGDAFPINSISQFKQNVLSNHQLAAVQRLENDGDTQPHPCFCMCTVKFWNDIQGDWKAGKITWDDKYGNKVSDVGGQMIERMKTHNVDWYKLTRTNNHSLHPLLFGVYDNLIYHHGAAFRVPGTRVDRNNVKNYNARLKRFRFAKKIMPKKLARKLFLPLKHEVTKNNKNSALIYKKIQQNHLFYTELGEKND
ncbi:hypothetical protein [Marinicella rhabdoformis]|uniref:hypothetical protein n=1 Tax=Marinicella rhabdoformis TaxID=2580566 RepID=UPI0015D0AA66|nr:hypothetical protein [Marinicella rhabdoformis]